MSRPPAKVSQLSTCRILQQVDWYLETSSQLSIASKFGSFLKQGYPQINHFNKIFPYKPSNLGYPHVPPILGNHHLRCHPVCSEKIASKGCCASSVSDSSGAVGMVVPPSSLFGARGNAGSHRFSFPIISRFPTVGSSPGVALSSRFNKLPGYLLPPSSSKLRLVSSSKRPRRSLRSSTGVRQ